MSTSIQFLRSSTPQLRANPGALADGMPYLNLHESEPGLFFRARDGSSFKVGPVAVGPNAPNSSPTGHPGNTKGEMWLDTSITNNPILKIFDGDEWIRFQSGQDLFKDVEISDSLTVLGTSQFNTILDGTDSQGQAGQLLSWSGDDIRWRWIRTDNVIYVAKNGSDTNDGLSPTTPKATIKAGLAVSTDGFTVQVAPGDYLEDNPLYVPPGVAVEGSDLRTTTVIPFNDDDLFHVNNGCYVAEFSFRRETPVTYGRGMIAFSPDGAGVITQSPYVQNCTNFVANSTGLKVDGSLADGLKSMVLDSYTQFNPGGIGAHIFNGGYAQLVSMFTICVDKAVLVQSGGTTSITNSNSDFGNFGLVADGVGPLQFSGQVNGLDQTVSPYSIKNLTTAQRPYVGQVVTFGDLYYRVIGFEITNQGGGYSSPPSVTVSIGTGPNAIEAQGIATLFEGRVVGIELISSGQNYTGSDNITVTFSGGGGTGAAATAIKDPIYYTVESATPVLGGLTEVTLSENLPYTPNDGDTVNFYPVSRIISNSHCFEYIGSGTNIQTALPAVGGVPIPENEVVQINGGRVAVTSTDQLGNFKVGEGFTINQNTGTITGLDFTKSILGIVSPYILALS